jgi:phosphoglycerol transferase MdoB-like AlkP superfamily enzyme
MDRSYFRHATIPTLAGFTRHMDKERLKLTPEEAGGSWGGWDHVMLDRLFEVMRTEQEPFFNLWISLSSHPPFRTPNDPAIYPGVEKNTFKDTLHYTDHFLGRFFRRAREQDYFNRTIFIITADHPIKRIKTMEGRHLIPFLIYAPDIIQPGRNTRVASQLDVIPTLIDILNLDVSHHAMGTSIFKKKANRYGFLNYAQGYGWISGREILEVAPDGKLIGVHNLDTGEPGISNISSSMETLLSFVQVGKTLLLENRYAPPLWQRKAEDHRDIASLPEKHMK